MPKKIIFLNHKEFHNMNIYTYTMLTDVRMASINSIHRSLIPGVKQTEGRLSNIKT